MEKIIVPMQQDFRRWLNLFDEPFRNETHQLKVAAELISMSMTLAGGKIKNESRLGLHEAIHSYMEEIVDTGSIRICDWQAATYFANKFCGQLVSYLTNVGVIEQNNKQVKLIGFLGSNIIIKTSDNIDDEFDEMDEREWREY